MGLTFFPLKEEVKCLSVEIQRIHTMRKHGDGRLSSFKVEPTQNGDGKKGPCYLIFEPYQLAALRKKKKPRPFSSYVSGNEGGGQASGIRMAGLGPTEKDSAPKRKNGSSRLSSIVHWERRLDGSKVTPKMHTRGGFPPGKSFESFIGGQSRSLQHLDLAEIRFCL
ncbi:hypothetical protein CDAR_233071 [Caerostris darwini]|uniref:Uncharacterized protein n=1 Tax=Caerostris darwini TaxID=1538125 RepID=A0AAV4Q4W9_9ARAC|nr:hypothetical protein CDAR_233071 [Caerostris darwini]